MRKLQIATTAMSAVLVFQSTYVFAAETKDKAKGSHEDKNELAPEVSLKDLKTIVKDKSATIIDANAESTYDKGHIPTAVSYVKNKTTFDKALPADKSAPLIAYCGGPMCTAWEEAAKVAKGLGYTNIRHYKGGLMGWKEAGMPLATN